MALTKVRRGGTDTGISDSSDATAITIDSSENVGIGTSSLTGGNTILDLHKSGSGVGTNIAFANDHNTDKFFVGIAGDTSGDVLIFNAETSNMIFGTNNSEKMRVDSDGRLMVQTTSSTIGGSSGAGNEGVVLGGSLGNAIAVSNGGCLDLNRKTTSGTIVEFRFNGVSVGSISTHANSLPSDKNFKRDIKDLNIGLDLVSQLQPKSFNLIVDNENSPVMYGLVAQDLEIALEKVGVTKNSAWILQHEEKNDAKESDYSLDYSKLIPILINAIKELQVKVTALESK